MNRDKPVKTNIIWNEDNAHMNCFIPQSIYNNIMEAIHNNKAKDMIIICGIKSLDQIAKLSSYEAKTKTLTVAECINVLIHLSYEVDPWDILVSGYTTKV